MQIKACLNHHEQQIVMKEYQETKYLLDNVTSKMFFLLNEIENISARSAPLSEIASPAPRLFDKHHRPEAVQAFSQVNTPRLTIQEYAKSPLIKKKSRAQLKFSDFEEVVIRREDFEVVPSYLRGRISLGELQEFLDTTIIKCFNSKYELLYKERSALKQSEFQLQNHLKQQESYFDQKFITIGDLARQAERSIDRKDESKIKILRHLKILKEVRKSGGAICYLWIVK
jgi:Spindle and kinetochore-associated protein 1